jgi:hypothetical protein
MAPAKKDKAADAAQEVQAQVDHEEELGYRGTKTDPTPNEAYTVGGVLKDMPTPETDADAKAEAEQAAKEVDQA